MNDRPDKDKPSDPPDSGKHAEVSESLDIAVAPQPAADEAVKEALNIAESVGASEGDLGDNLGLQSDDAGHSLSLNQIIDQAERRSRPFFEQDFSPDNEPLEELDALEIAAQFGRPSEESGSAIGETAEDSVDGFNDTKDLTPKISAIPDAVPDAVEAPATPPTLPPPEVRTPVPEAGERAGVPQATFGVPTQSEIPRPPGAASGRTQPPTAAPSRVVAPTPIPSPRSPRPTPVPTSGTAMSDTSPMEEKPVSDAPAADTDLLADNSQNDIDAAREMVAMKLSAIREGTYFDILEVPATASEKEVLNARNNLLRQFRVDRFQHSMLSDMKKEVSLIRTIVDEAYDVLRKPELREMYRRAAVDAGD